MCLLLYYYKKLQLLTQWVSVMTLDYICFDVTDLSPPLTVCAYVCVYPQVLSSRESILVLLFVYSPSQ